jgi:hypothetical protein
VSTLTSSAFADRTPHAWEITSPLVGTIRTTLTEAEVWQHIVKVNDSLSLPVAWEANEATNRLELAEITIRDRQFEGAVSIAWRLRPES